MAAHGASMQAGVIITHPNRDKPAVQGTRALVVGLLLLSATLVALITVAGWKVLEGAVPVEVAYVALYLLLAYLAVRWNRGALPASAGLAVFLLIFAGVAAPGWFERDKSGYTKPLLSASLLGLLTLLVIPLQLLLVVFAMRGLGEGWNVEVEQRSDRVTGSFSAA